MLIDGPYLAHRSVGAPYRLTTSTGLDATLIHGFMRALNSLRKKFQPEKIIVAWESYGTTSWRRKMYPEYKRKRGKTTSVFWSGVKDVQLFLHLLGIEQYFSSGNEADDVISKLAVNDCINETVVIFTTDKDLMQIVDNRCHVYNGKEIFDAEKVKEKYRVMPKQIPDLLAVWGDVSDNIDGIVSYGLIKTSKLLEKYGSVDNIPESSTVYKYQSKMLFNKKLTTLNSNCALSPIPSKNFKTDESIDTLLEKYELKQMKKDIAEYQLVGGIDKWIS